MPPLLLSYDVYSTTHNSYNHRSPTAQASKDPCWIHRFYCAERCSYRNRSWINRVPSVSASFVLISWFQDAHYVDGEGGAKNPKLFLPLHTNKANGHRHNEIHMKILNSPICILSTTALPDNESSVLLRVDAPSQGREKLCCARLSHIAPIFPLPQLLSLPLHHLPRSTHPCSLSSTSRLRILPNQLLNSRIRWIGWGVSWPDL